MGVYLIYLAFILGLAMFAYYIYIIITGKRLARLVGSKDRYIWNGLKNISDPAMPFAKKRNTLFLDHDNLVISNSHVVSILRELKQTDGLDQAIVIPFQRIVSFDYKRSVADWNPVVRTILSLWNRLIKKNDYHLSVRYLDEDRSIRQFLFKANSMDVNDFEATFADFDNQIYSGKVRYEAEHGMNDDYIAKTPPSAPAPQVEEDSPTVAIRGSQIPEVIIPVKELSQTEELPILVVDDAPEEPVVAAVDEPAAAEVVETDDPVQPERELEEIAQEQNDPSIDDIDEPIEEIHEEDDYSETIRPVRRREKTWFEEDYMPRKTKQETVEDPAEQTVMMSREELMKKDVIFERPRKIDKTNE